MVGIDSVNQLAFCPETLIEWKIFGFCFLVFFSSPFKIVSDCQKKEELSEDKHYQYKVGSGHKTTLHLRLVISNKLKFFVVANIEQIEAVFRDFVHFQKPLCQFSRALYLRNFSSAHKKIELSSINFKVIRDIRIMGRACNYSLQELVSC